ncbi:MAG: hypothetical protein J0H60_17290 [Rhizobiales bacterium]|nr:hypothetical protein [Hyphomicrobiales bacterium]
MIRRVSNVVLLVVAVALCYGMQTSTPHYARLTGLIPVRGGIGETIEARSFSLKVAKIGFAHTLKLNAFGKEKVLTTGGLWAIVTAELAARDASTSVWGGIWQGPAGLRYRTSERLGVAPGAPPFSLEPGLPRKVRFVFEIPADQAANATLLVASARFSALDSEAQIKLGTVETGADGLPAGVIETFDLDQPI